MSQQNGDNPRIDRIERVLETIVAVQQDMQQEHQMLLRAQVVQGDEIRQLQKRTDEKFQSLAAAQERVVAAQERMEEALTAVMGTLDGFGKRTDQRFEEEAARTEERLAEQAARAEERLAEQAARAEERLAEQAAANAEAARRSDAMLQGLAESQKLTDAKFRELADALKKRSDAPPGLS